MALTSYDVGDFARQLTAELLVVMPIYNEEVSIAAVLAEWLAALRSTGASFTLLALNDGSRDGTWARLLELEKSAPKEIVALDKLNTGHGLTCRLGYDIAAASSAAWVLQVDSDGQCDPAYFPEFWRRRAEADCIFGERTSRGDGPARRATSWLCSAASSLATGTSLSDANVPYRLLSVPVLRRALAFIPRHFNVQNVALAVTLRRMPEVRWAQVPIHFRDRQGGTNSINLAQVSKLGIEMLVQLGQLGDPRRAA